MVLFVFPEEEFFSERATNFCQNNAWAASQKALVVLFRKVALV